MSLLENLPDDSKSLKQYIFSLVNKYNLLEQEKELLAKDKQLLTKENKFQQNRITKLESILFDFQRRMHGSKSEKFDPKDLYYGFLFDEAEKGLHDEDKLIDGHSETIHVKTFTRKKAGRKALPADLKRKEFIHDIPEPEKTCNCGFELTQIGEEISEKLTIIPAEIYVEKHIRLKMELSKQMVIQATMHIFGIMIIYSMQGVWHMQEESLKRYGRQIKILALEIF